METADYIIVGGGRGSAGCVLADRLTRRRSAVDEPAS